MCRNLEPILTEKFNDATNRLVCTNCIIAGKKNLAKIIASCLLKSLS